MQFVHLPCLLALHQIHYCHVVWRFFPLGTLMVIENCHLQCSITSFSPWLAEDSKVDALMGHENPMIKQCVKRSGGKWEIGDPSDPGAVLDFAKRHKVDYTFVSSGEPLANGVVDVLLEHGFRCVGATKTTDGLSLVLSPASYDYPYRHVGDTGAGTGGMGCFTDAKPVLPFMTQKDLDDCQTMMERVIDAMRKKGTPFTGVLNGGFFKTKSGIRFMEWNGRFGDPEGLNVLMVLDGSLSGLLKSIWDKTLSGDSVKFANKASVIKYMVAKEYPGPSPDAVPFLIDEDSVNALGVNLFFASCVQTGKHTYQTLKTSRVVAFGALGDTIGDASELVDKAIKYYFRGDLEYRHDIGTPQYVASLKQSTPS